MRIAIFCTFFSTALAIAPAQSRENRASSAARPLAAPLLRAHSHNDYNRRRPLVDALREGFFSVEADLVLRNGRILVAHEHATARAERSLEKLYLAPLRARARAHAGRVYRDGPLGFRLLLDCKDRPEVLWPALQKQLSEYADILSSWDEQGARTERAVRVVLSGRKPWKLVAHDASRSVAFDASLAELERERAAGTDVRITLCSEPWKRHFRWTGNGRIPPEELASLRSLVLRAHQASRPLRFWGVPAKARVWKRLFDENVDVLHTDNVRGLAAFLRARRLPAMPEAWKRIQTKTDLFELWTLERSKPPLRASLVRADLARGQLELRPVLAEGTALAKGRAGAKPGKAGAPCSELARTSGALALINASFFVWTENGVAPYGAFALDGKFLTNALSHVVSKASGARYEVARSALVWRDATRAPDLAWIGYDEATKRHVEYETPPAHTKAKPSTQAQPRRQPLATIRHVLQAGPMLLQRGRVLLPASANAERMFVHDKRHPRSAFGRSGEVVYLLVVDGRSSLSRGATLLELATMLRELGVRDAINFDGGGSSTLIVEGELRNRPSSAAVERKVPTALGLFAR